MRMPDVRVSGDARTAAVTLGAEAPRRPVVDLELTPRAARELAREIVSAAEVAEGNAVTRRNDAGEPVSWSDAVGFRLSAFVPTNSIEAKA